MPSWGTTALSDRVQSSPGHSIIAMSFATSFVFPLGTVPSISFCHSLTVMGLTSHIRISQAPNSLPKFIAIERTAWELLAWCSGSSITKQGSVFSSFTHSFTAIKSTSLLPFRFSVGITILEITQPRHLEIAHKPPSTPLSTPTII